MTQGMTPKFAALLVCLALGLGACSNDVDREASGPSGADPLFTQVMSDASGVDFANTIQEDLVVNILTFEYIYNGGGVAVGDIDGDDLPDLFFTSTQGANRLYRNVGDFQFEDITETAGVAGRDSSMTTGVSMADVNADGWLDIYVSQTGKPEWSFDRRNLLYMNQGDGTFLEQAVAYGVDSEGYSNQSVFFDYDADGDLDFYLINHPPSFTAANTVRPPGSEREPNTSDQLFRNDGDRFTEVTDQAGVRNYAFGLSATPFDLDQDGDLDLYVANDYIQPDFLYSNNGDGTFTDIGRETMLHTSHFGMGSDAGDINNDGLEDIVVLDMMAEDSRRQKLLGSVMMFDRYELQRRFGYGEQVMRNTLHLNNGDGTFSEIGQLAGISTTDWSWGPLLADFDLDGWRDLFIANGYRREVTNMDYSQFTVDSLNRAGGGRARVSDINEYLDLVPSEKIGNYAYRNRGDLTFENVSDAWGLGDPSFSNGAIAADLDGDGDADLVVNDLDGPARLYRNNATEAFPDRHWLTVQLDGPASNPDGIGARISVEAAVDSTRMVTQSARIMTTRGFYSSAPPVANFGLGRSAQATVRVQWPDGLVSEVTGVEANQYVTVSHVDAQEILTEDIAPLLLFEPIQDSGLDFEHQEDPFIDFKRDPLVPHMFSREGPALAVGDLNGDGLDDLFLGGAAGQGGSLFLQTQDGRFAKNAAAQAVLDAHGALEDTRAVMADFDGDGALDLYVASGGSHVLPNSEGDPSTGTLSAAQAYQDRLYLGDGAGGLLPAPDGSLPAMPVSSGAVAAGDMDGDGDLDLFVGGRVVPGRYPESPRSYLLRNEGDGRYSDVTAELASGLMTVGHVTGAQFADLDGDGQQELALAGEWMPVQIWSPSGNGRWALDQDGGLEPTVGWWNSLSVLDLDGDGDLDLLGGNLGLNSRVGGSAEQPVRIHARDFDGNGSYEGILSRYYPNGRSYPYARREAITKQLPYLQRRFPRFGVYASSSIDEVFPGELGGALVREASWFETTWFENDGSGSFTPHVLPIAAQLAPVYSSVMRDVNADGRPDLILAGNLRSADVERGPYDALRGAVLVQDGDGFSAVPTWETGLSLRGDVRAMAWVQTASGSVLVVANNNAPVERFRLNGGQ